MDMFDLLLVVVVVLLALIFWKLKELVETLREEPTSQGKQEDKYSVKGWLEILNRNIYEVSKSVGVLADDATKDSPAGSDSVKFKKKKNLIKELTEHLVRTEKLSQKEAAIKADFIVNRFDEEDIIRDINSDIDIDESRKADSTYFSSGILEREINEVMKDVIHHDLMAPLYDLIAKGNAVKGDTIAQMDWFYEDNADYRGYVKNLAVIKKLEELGVIKKTDKKKVLGEGSIYTLEVADLGELRKLFYKDGATHDDAHFEERFQEGKLQRLFYVTTV